MTGAVAIAPAMERRFLPAVPDSGFVLGTHEHLSESLRRITVEQADSAARGLMSGQVDAAVHEARKAMKRLRAVLRLIRSEIGDDAYRWENTVLRDAARSVAPIRDGVVMVNTVDRIRERYEGQIAEESFAELRAALVGRSDRLRRRVLDDREIIPGVIRTLRSARVRYSSWPVESDDPMVLYGRSPIPHAFESIAPGLGRTYGRGRKEMARAIAHPTAANFHLWRKRAKYLRHQAEILQPLWPDAVGGLAQSLEQLGEWLGDDHDLAILLKLISDIPELCPDMRERSFLAALAQHRRAELQMASISLGSRIYAERPNQFVSRFGVYWKAWDAPTPLGYSY